MNISDDKLHELRGLAELLPAGPYTHKTVPTSAQGSAYEVVTYQHEYLPGQFATIRFAERMGPEEARFMVALDKQTCLTIIDELLALRAGQSK